jgi:hypothetical protein
MMFHLLKSHIGQHTTPGLVLNPGFELRLGLVVKFLKTQVGHNMVPMLGIGGFALWHCDRPRGGQIELLPSIVDNVGRQIRDVIEETAV